MLDKVAKLEADAEAAIASAADAAALEDLRVRAAWPQVAS